MDTKDPNIDNEIKRLLEHMSNIKVDSDEYEVAQKRLQRLYEMKNNSRISPEVWIGAATNLAGILLILNHERLNVISSRAIMFIKRSS